MRKQVDADEKKKLRELMLALLKSWICSWMAKRMLERQRKLERVDMDTTDMASTKSPLEMASTKSRARAVMRRIRQVV